MSKPLGPKGFTKRLHKSRLIPKDIKDDPELSKAWNNLQLHWLQSVPGYRETIKQRVSDAKKGKNPWGNTERLEKIIGREIDRFWDDNDCCG